MRVPQGICVVACKPGEIGSLRAVRSEYLSSVPKAVFSSGETKTPEHAELLGPRYCRSHQGSNPAAESIASLLQRPAQLLSRPARAWARARGGASKNHTPLQPPLRLAPYRRSNRSRSEECMDAGALRGWDPRLRTVRRPVAAILTSAGAAFPAFWR